MKNDIKKNINFIINEIKRLKKKQKNKNLTKEEKTTLDKLNSFLGKNDK